MATTSGSGRLVQARGGRSLPTGSAFAAHQYHSGTVLTHRALIARHTPQPSRPTTTNALPSYEILIVMCMSFSLPLWQSMQSTMKPPSSATVSESPSNRSISPGHDPPQRGNPQPRVPTCYEGCILPTASLAGNVSYIFTNVTTPEIKVRSATPVIAHDAPKRSANSPASSAPPT